MQKVLLTLFLVLLIGVAWAYYSDEDGFLLGCYSYFNPDNTNQNNNDILDYMQNARYNATIWSSLYNDLTNTNALLLNAGSTHRIDSFVSDYYTAYDNNGDLTTAGTYALSTGNNWKLEAEYETDDNLSTQDTDEETKWKNFHKYHCDTIYRAGRFFSAPNASNGYIWRVDPAVDNPGSALGDLKFRWPEGDFNNASTGNYNTIGGEFRFALYDGANPNGSKYLAWNKLYITFAYYLYPTTQGTANALKFGCKFKYLDNQDSQFEFFRITLVDPTTHQPTGNTEKWPILTYDQLNDPTITSSLGNNYRSITFCVDLWALRNDANHNYVDTSGYWWGNLFGINLTLSHFLPHL